jgi:hypothetical protein
MEFSKPKISLAEAYLLIAFAIISDLINWIPVVNWIVTLVTLPGFQLYFYLRGVKGYAALAGNIIELIPFLSVLPCITVGVILVILIDRAATTRLGAKLARVGSGAKSLQTAPRSNAGAQFKEPLKAARASA